MIKSFIKYINELAISNIDQNNIDRFNKSKDRYFKEKFETFWNKIKKSDFNIYFDCKNIKKLSSDNIDYYFINFNENFILEHKKIMNEILNIESDNLMIKIKRIFEIKNFKILDIQIDKLQFNKIDIIGEIPDKLRNKGIGKKIYKYFTDKYGYITSNSVGGSEPTEEANGLWKSLSNESDYFSFVRNPHFY